MKTLLLSVLVLSSYLFAFGQSKSQGNNGPDCGGPDHWAANMTFAHLKNAGLVDKNNISEINAVRMASQKIGRDLWHQVYKVTLTKKSGGIVETITVHDASTEECSMSGVEVFVVSRHLGDIEEKNQK